MRVNVVLENQKKLPFRLQGGRPGAGEFRRGTLEHGERTRPHSALDDRAATEHRRPDFQAKSTSFDWG